MVNWLGAWSASPTYARYDAVSSAGSSYLATSVNTNDTPPSASWALMAQKGDTGAQGPIGNTGPQGPAGTVSAAGPGTAAAPSISFAADTNTGFYNSNPDEVSISTNGVQRWLVNATGFSLMPAGTGDKLFLYNASPNFYGFGIQVNQLVSFAPSAASFVWAGGGTSTGAVAATLSAAGSFSVALYLTAGSATNAGGVYVDGPAASQRTLTIRTAGSNRWMLHATNTAESGSNLGSNLAIWRYTDAGAFVDQPFIIQRDSGRVDIGSQLNLVTTAPLSWNQDVFLVREAANTLAQRNGTNAQMLRLYGTYTDGSNFERLNVGANATDFTIGIEKAGTGGTRTLRIGAFNGGGPVTFVTNGVDAWQVTANRHFVAPTDNTYDIGASGATRPRTIYAGTNMIAAGALQTGVKAGAATDGDVTGPADGMIRLDSTNNRAYFRIGGTWRYAALT